MTTSAPPAARRQFARRLRDLRIARGFKTARSLARALGIDENRYTRYERAEVEPDLVLIQQICETLRVTPNELFAAADQARRGEPAYSTPAALDAGGFAEPASASPVSPDARMRRDSVTWTLACAVAELQVKAETITLADATPLAALQRAARLFADLERRPFGAVSEILLLPAVVGASQGEARRIGELIEVFARAVT